MDAQALSRLREAHDAATANFVEVRPADVRDAAREVAPPDEAVASLFRAASWALLNPTPPETFFVYRRDLGRLLWRLAALEPCPAGLPGFSPDLEEGD